MELQLKLEALARQYGFRFVISKLADAMQDEALRQKPQMAAQLDESAELLEKAAAGLPLNDQGMYKLEGGGK